jgi:hypothetical protein
VHREVQRKRQKGREGERQEKGQGKEEEKEQGKEEKEGQEETAVVASGCWPISH